MKIEDVIIAPVLTEKTVALREEAKPKYVLKVDRRANKLEVMQAVAAVFKVKPIACNIINVHGKKKTNLPVSKTSFKRGFGMTSSWKKAIVTLAKGQRIAEFEGA